MTGSIICLFKRHRFNIASNFEKISFVGNSVYITKIKVCEVCNREYMRGLPTNINVLDFEDLEEKTVTILEEICFTVAKMGTYNKRIGWTG